MRDYFFRDFLLVKADRREKKAEDEEDARKKDRNISAQRTCLLNLCVCVCVCVKRALVTVWMEIDGLTGRAPREKTRDAATPTRMASRAI